MKNKVILTAVFIFFLSFLNFQFNLFNVVSEFRFNYFQVESEQFVLDGFLNHSINDEPLQLGQFSRPSIDMFNDGEKYKPREWFINKFIEGEFWEYKSHFGLQLIIFNFFNGNLLLVQSLASFLFSLTIAILFIQLCRVHSFNFGLIFIASLVFNPWITPIARNSYFLVFIYLVPLVISYYFSRRINNSNFSLVIFLFILFTLFLFKSLIGYDYLSTIVITSMIPIVYYYLKNHLSVKKLITNLTSILLISFLSFSTSVVIHSDSLESEESPFEWIYYTAAKRLSSSSPEETARVACEKLMIDQAGKINVNDEAYQACYDEFLESLSVSRLNVLAKYMAARHLVPFFGSYEIEAYKTTGHTEDGMSFKVTGLSNNIMFVGDALFAHSQGGIYSREAYRNALTINRSNILSQSDDTIIAPGHGPLTTVSHEKQNNPFYAKSANGLHTP